MQHERILCGSSFPTNFPVKQHFPINSLITGRTAYPVQRIWGSESSRGGQGSFLCTFLVVEGTERGTFSGGCIYISEPRLRGANPLPHQVVSSSTMAALGSAVCHVHRNDTSSSTCSSASSSLSPSSLLSKAGCVPFKPGFGQVTLQLGGRNAEVSSSAVFRDESDGACSFFAATSFPWSSAAARKQSSVCNAVSNRNASPSEAAGAAVSQIGTQVAGFQTVSAEITQQTEQFFASEAEGDPDQPSPGFASVGEAVEAIQQGKFVVVVDDEDRENEGDLIMAASLVTAEAIAFMVKHGTGIICVGMKADQLERLNIPLMVKEKENEDALRTAFTITVDAKTGTTTGVSASDRAKTIRDLASPDSKPEHFRRPGHIFPLRYREGGVLKRAGHTEASVDLATLAGLAPAGVLCELVDPDDGSMSRLPKLKEFAKEHNILLISIADLVRYRRKRERLVTRTAVARLPTKWGTFQAYSYRSQLDGIEHIAMVKGDIGNGIDVLVRVHSECLTGDIFDSARCDCGNQLSLAMQEIEKAGRGVLVYLRGHEGRGIGLGHKLRAYNLQDAGRDTVEANVELGLPIDSREYGIGAQILRDVGVQTMKLMTNNPSKFVGLRGYGLAVTGRVPVISPITKENKRYLETKRAKMGHMYGSDIPGSRAGVIVPDANDSVTGAEIESAG